MADSLEGLALLYRLTEREDAAEGLDKRITTIRAKKR